MSELEKREQEIAKQFNEYAYSLSGIKPRESALNYFFVKKIAELELKIEALESTNIK